MAAKTKQPPEVNGNGRLPLTIPVPEKLQVGKPGKGVHSLVIPQPKNEIIEVPIRGITPLMVHPWNIKGLQQLADKSSLTADEVKEMQTPEWRFEHGRYVSTEGWEGMHAAAFKAAIIEALPVAGIPKETFPQTLGRVTFFVVEDGRSSTFGEPLVRIQGKSEPFKNICSLGNGTPYPNCRAVFQQWSAKLRVRYNAIVIARQMVLNLIAFAGYYVGVGEHRPSSPYSKTGTNGCWEIVPTDK